MCRREKERERERILTHPIQAIQLLLILTRGKKCKYTNNLFSLPENTHSSFLPIQFSSKSFIRKTFTPKSSPSHSLFPRFILSSQDSFSLPKIHSFFPSFTLSSQVSFSLPKIHSFFPSFTLSSQVSLSLPKFQ